MTPKHVTRGAIALAVVVFAVLAYQRRWISDDGLIVVRVARQIVEGFGPNYNFFERAEPNTSALWMWLVAIGGLVTRGNVAYIAVILGGLLSIAGFVLALDAARRLHHKADTAIVPCGALVVLGVFPFWDYATSGLETGLAFAWVSASYWLLVTTSKEPSRRHLATAFVLGLGLLVRPDYALVALPMLGGLWWLLRPTRRRTLVLAAAAFALPIAYTIFRAGYYGTLVPLPALAKSAASAEWARGARFIGTFVVTYHLWLPLVALAALLVEAVRRGAIVDRTRVLVALPIACGLLLVIYVARVGGDFMHGRMLLVPLWLVLLPAFAIPLRRITAPAIGLVALWALVTAITTRHLEDPGEQKRLDWYNDADERARYVIFTGNPNPIDPALFVAADPAAQSWRLAQEQGLPPLLIWDGNGSRVLLDPTLDVPVAIAAGRLGTAGMTAPLDGIVVDLLGLANPLGARITITKPGETGHEKVLPASWVIAEYADPAAIARAPDDQRAPIEAAKRALQCGEIAELLASVREPMTPSRFWANLVGAWRRTRLVVPADPIEAERRFCGTDK